ncbi:MAG: DUF1566 domain-containing protein, partial [Desulfuromonadaceae bacterium]|nr:DUF1566 domain-containing protein [Desulfuromonadaceae bacterium]
MKNNLKSRTSNKSSKSWFRRLLFFTLFILNLPFSGVVHAAPAATPKTGQTVSYAAGDDGALQPGIASPVPRFVDNAKGTVTDTLTGLTWLKDANCFGTQMWDAALVKSNTLASGTCGLNDGSEAGDWHLPNSNELWSLVDYGRSNPALPAGHPFANVQSSNYWSGSTYANGTNSAWYVYMIYGFVGYDGKTYFNYVWPVRSGQSWVFGSLILSADATDMGNLLIGATGASGQIRIRNSGAAAASFSAQLSGVNTSEYTVTPGGTAACASLNPTLAAGEACTLLVTAKPTSSGAKTASLSITSAGATKDIPFTATAYSTIFGTITDQSTNLPVSGATVTLNTGTAITTDASGFYDFGPLVPATYSITVTKTGYQNASNSASNLIVSTTQNAKADFVLPTVGTFNITSTMLPSATAGTAYSSRVMVTGGTFPYTFSKVYGNLPDGLTLDTNTGIISGTPSGSGSFTFAIGVTDNTGAYSEREFTIDLTATLAITTSSIPRALTGSSY